MPLSRSRIDAGPRKPSSTGTVLGTPQVGPCCAGKAGARFLAASLNAPVDLEAGDRLLVRLEQGHGNQHVMGRFRISFGKGRVDALAPDSEKLAILTPAQELALRSDPEVRTKEQELDLERYARDHSGLFEDLRRRERELQGRQRTIDRAIVTCLVTETMKPLTVRVLPRGNWLDESGPVVEPEIPEFLRARTGWDAAERERRATRLDLANWLFAEENPLTARVFVNRIWKMLLGRGLVPRSMTSVRRALRPGTEGCWITSRGAFASAVST